MRDRAARALGEVDPINWLSDRRVPLVLAIVTAVICGDILLRDRDQGVLALQLAALVICVLADLVMYVAARRLPRVLTWRSATIVLGLCSAGVILSAVGYRGARIPIESWWGPIALAITIGLLATFLPWREQIVLGAAVNLVVVAVSAVLLVRSSPLAPVATIVAIAVPPVSSTVLCSVFSHYAVGRMRRLLDAVPEVVVPPVPDLEAEHRELQRLARLTARAVPFLEDLVSRGVVTDADRALAGQLARQLRDDLVTDANATWLDDMGAPRLVVVDPDRLADRLTLTQRTLLRGTIRTILSTPAVDQESLLVQLRAGEGSSVRVALSMEAELPEGRRTFHLRPFLLTLQSTADEIELVNKDVLRITLAFDGGPEGEVRP